MLGGAEALVEQDKVTSFRGGPSPDLLELSGAQQGRRDGPVANLKRVTQNLRASSGCQVGELRERFRRCQGLNAGRVRASPRPEIQPREDAAFGRVLTVPCKRLPSVRAWQAGTHWSSLSLRRFTAINSGIGSQPNRVRCRTEREPAPTDEEPEGEGRRDTPPTGVAEGTVAP